MEPWVPSSVLDRAADGRSDPAWVAALWAHPESRVFGVDARSTVTASTTTASTTTALRVGLRWQRPAGPYVPERHLLVGLVEGRAWFVTEADVLGDVGVTASLRDLAPELDETLTDVAVTGVALVNWHRVAPYCGQCGALTEVHDGGHLRWCPTCERQRFPRTDPAVIVAVLDPDDRLLLAHQNVWEATRVSILAGFVEAGESLEQAVHREIAEEAGLRLTALRYVGSQPWPFPRSVMLGFVAHTADARIRVDGVEIAWARFYARDELEAAVASGDITLPTSASIASRIITAWREGDLS
ncbi:NAD(+) diphosphatase [Propioniciclava soli]|uniref:NAD(+) diphosphatase n=1 Tax=Propioniciclava soli TaxID=2775081 RepID=UPI001E5B1A6A|nr:NAD(+) diphosphatase [Propioniciclava soli]